MRRIFKTTALMTVILCMILLCGCSGKSKYAGVYNGPYSAKIVLFEDGTCNHLGDNAKWKVRSGNLTITVEYPDKYYLDVYVSEEAQELGAVYGNSIFGAYLLMMNDIDDSNIESMEYFERDGMLRIKLKEKDEDKVLRNALLAAEDVEKVEDYVDKGSVKKYEYKIAGNTIVTQFGDYIKQ